MCHLAVIILRTESRAPLELFSALGLAGKKSRKRIRAVLRETALGEGDMVHGDGAQCTHKQRKLGLALEEQETFVYKMRRIQDVSDADRRDEMS